MAGHSGYTTDLRNIPVEFFMGMIEGNIKKLFHTYGHKDCGLRQEELCNKIKKIISEKKKIIFELMDTSSKKKWSPEWDSKRSKYFNKLYDEEGFINMCFPSKYPKKNEILNQLLSRHIKFCKEKDVKREAVEKNYDFKACREYDSWIETEKASFTREYLRNVSAFKRPNVHKYFSTKDNPGGHDPRWTYNNSKLDCDIYNPTSKKYHKNPVEQAPTNDPQLPSSPNIRQGSQGKDGKSVTGRDSESEKTKPDVKKPLQTELPTPESQIPSPPNTQLYGTNTDKNIHEKPKAPASAVSRNEGKKDATSIRGEPPTNRFPTAQDESPPHAGNSLAPPKDARLTPPIQSVSATNTTISLSSSISTVQDTTSSSSSPSNSFPTAAVTKDQDGAPQATTTSDTLATTYPIESVTSVAPAQSSLPQPQAPVLTVHPAVTTGEDPRTPASSSANTVTTTSAASDSVTISTVSITAQPSISSTKQGPDISITPEAPPATSPSGTEITTHAADPLHTPLSSTTPSKDRDKEAKSATDALSKPNGPIQSSVLPLSKNTQQATEHGSNIFTPVLKSKPQSTPHHTDQQISQTAVRHTPNIDVVLSPSDKSRDTVKTVKVKTKTTSNGDITVRTNKNDNPNIIPEDIPSLKQIIPTLLVIVATITLFFQLYKYTPFGFLLGRRRKKKKKDLRRILEIPEKPTYGSPNITVHEWEGPNLIGKAVENDVYIKLLKINKYKQEMQKRKNKKNKTLIELHMEVLEESQNNEWELHKGDFLEICLRGFINDENDFYSNFPNSKLTINIINEKTIEDIQKQEILWNNWIENHRNILEQWKKEEWFHILKNKWRNEEQKYKEKNDKLQENILNEQETYSIVSQKDIWKQWIWKQATLIKMFNQEDWFKELVDEQNKEKNNYHINEYNNISVTSKTELKNEKTNHEHCRSKNIIQKLMVQIHMMILEECIKDEIIRNKELCIDNSIEDIHKQNNYDEK